MAGGPKHQNFGTISEREYISGTRQYISLIGKRCCELRSLSTCTLNLANFGPQTENNTVHVVSTHRKSTFLDAHILGAKDQCPIVPKISQLVENDPKWGIGLPNNNLAIKIRKLSKNLVYLAVLAYIILCTV